MPLVTCIGPIPLGTAELPQRDRPSASATGISTSSAYASIVTRIVCHSTYANKIATEFLGLLVASLHLISSQHLCQLPRELKRRLVEFRHQFLDALAGNRRDLEFGAFGIG